MRSKYLPQLSSLAQPLEKQAIFNALFHGLKSHYVSFLVWYLFLLTTNFLYLILDRLLYRLTLKIFWSDQLLLDELKYYFLNLPFVLILPQSSSVQLQIIKLLSILVFQMTSMLIFFLYLRRNFFETGFYSIAQIVQPCTHDNLPASAFQVLGLQV